MRVCTAIPINARLVMGLGKWLKCEAQPAYSNGSNTQVGSAGAAFFFTAFFAFLSSFAAFFAFLAFFFSFLATFFAFFAVFFATFFSVFLIDFFFCFFFAAFFFFFVVAAFTAFATTFFVESFFFFRGCRSFFRRFGVGPCFFFFLSVTAPLDFTGGYRLFHVLAFFSAFFTAFFTPFFLAAFFFFFAAFFLSSSMISVCDARMDSFSTSRT